ncbi:MAG: hypothetical protein SNJ75_09950 [Gemmataceae bacterium]
MLRTLLTTGMALLLLSLPASDTADETPKETKPKETKPKETKPKETKPSGRPLSKEELMKKKLELSQQMLAALAINDLDKTAQLAEGLLDVRRALSWRVIKTEMYDALSDDYARALTGIIKAAKEKNYESAKLNYLGMTMSCFNCHTYVRDRKDS